MKQLFFSFLLLITIGATAQMPKAINYQAVARNAQGQALANQSIKVRLSILSGSSGAPTLYSETRSVTTNALGLFNVQIGGPGALSTTGIFTEIDWVHSQPVTKSLKVELDINNTGTYTDMGTQTLVSVPFALAADQAYNAVRIGGNSIAETAPDQGDVLKWNNTGWAPAPAVKIYPISQDISGSVAQPSILGFRFVGTPTAVVLKEGQTVTTVLSAILGCSSGSALEPGISPAFKASGSQSLDVATFLPSNYPIVASISTRSLFTVSGTLRVVASNGNPNDGTITAGSYLIGFAVRNVSPTPINNNRTLNGFIQVQ